MTRPATAWAACGKPLAPERSLPVERGHREQAAASCGFFAGVWCRHVWIEAAWYAWRGCTGRLTPCRARHLVHQRQSALLPCLACDDCRKALAMGIWLQRGQASTWSGFPLLALDLQQHPFSPPSDGQLAIPRQHRDSEPLADFIARSPQSQGDAEAADMTGITDSTASQGRRAASGHVQIARDPPLLESCACTPTCQHGYLAAAATIGATGRAYSCHIGRITHIERTVST